jgi:hypothetical protein
MRALALVPALAGCNLVFGVDPVATADAPVDPDASRTEVRGTLAHVFVHNDSLGAPIAETGALVAEKQCPAAFVGDAPLAVTCDAAAGTFSFTLPADTRYRLVSDINEYVTDSRAPSITFIEWGRPDAVPSSTTQALTINLFDSNNLGVSGAFFYASTGVWTGPAVATASVGSVEVPWTGPLLDATKGDFLYAYREKAPLTPRPSYIVTIDRGRVPVAMAPDVATAARIQLEPLTADRCVHVALDVPREQDRLAILFPDVPPWRRGYSVYSAASLAHGASGLNYLSRDVIDLSAAMDGPMAFEALDPYPPAIEGHETLLFRFVDRYDKTTLAYAGVQVFDQLAAATCTDPAVCCESPSPFPDAAIPTRVVLRDGALTGPDQVIGLPADEAPIARWTLGAGPTPDRIVVTLLRRDPPATLVAVHRWILPPDQDRVAIDPALLAPGTTYHLQVSADRGFPNTAQGQFGLPFVYPLVSAVARSQPFSITN